MAKVRSLLSPANWPSWSFWLYKGVDAWGNADFMRGKLAAMKSFLDSGWAILLAFIWLFVVVMGWHRSLLALARPKNDRLRSAENSLPDAHAAQPVWSRHFNELFQFEINQVFLRGLWKDDISHGVCENPEPFMQFQIVVRNNTDLRLAMAGCRGSASIDGDTCTLPASMEGLPEAIAPWAYATPTIKQPFLGGKGEDLVNAVATSRRVRVSLSSVMLLVEGDGFPQRAVPVGVSFDMDGTGVQPATGIDGLGKAPLVVKRP